MDNAETRHRAERILVEAWNRLDQSEAARPVTDVLRRALHRLIEKLR